MVHRNVRIVVAATFALAVESTVEAQFAEQTVRLGPGWNPIYLEVSPSPSETTALLAQFPQIESVWSYDNRYGGEETLAPEEFDLPNPPVPVKRRWHVFHPGHPAVCDLFHLRGGGAYLIRVRAGSAPWTWNATGTPTPTEHWWVPDDYTLTGFPVDPTLPQGSAPTLAQYFSGSPAHLADACKVYSMSSDGSITGPLNKATERIQYGKAYFVYTPGVSTYSGPIGVRTPYVAGIDFGTNLVEDILQLTNPTSADVAVTLRLTPGLEAPAGAPTNAGPARLRYFDAEAHEWRLLGGGGSQIVVPAGGSRRVRLAAQRQGLPPATKGGGAGTAPGSGDGAGADGGDSSYQGVVSVTTPTGVQTSVPVSMEVPDFAGLWVGTVRQRCVRKLERSAPPIDPETGRAIIDPLTGKPFPGAYSAPAGPLDPKADAAPELTFPVVLHVGAGGKFTMLQQVTVMWKNGKPDDPATPQNEFQSGRYVLLTRAGIGARLIQTLGLVGGTLKDGRSFSFRKTSPLFHKDFALDGASGEFTGTGTWSKVIDLPANHPLNPYLHRYHPDHGHPKVMWDAGKVPATGGIDIRRTITLTFTATDPWAEGQVTLDGKTYTDVTPQGYGDQVLGGTYREIIESLTYDPVIVEGTFRLVKSVEGIAVLNDGIDVE